MPVTLFLSTDTGAPSIARTGGQLTTLLDQCLVLQKLWSFDGGSTYTDNSTEARLLASTAFALLPTGASGEIAYFGGQAKFAQIILKLGTVMTGGTFVYEYYNSVAAAWQTLVSAVDGTSALTANGAITWAIADQTNWGTVAVNGVTAFWVRIRSTASTPSQNAQCNSASLYGWNVAYSGTNGRTYQSQIVTGVQHWFTVNDNDPNGNGNNQEAALWGNESDPLAYQTAPTSNPQTFPTSAQKAVGGAIRKSNASDTAKVWWLLMDEKTVYMGIQTLDTGTSYHCFGFGEFFSLVSGDLYRSFVAVRLTFNSAAFTGGLCPLSNRDAMSQFATAVTNKSLFLARGYAGVGSAVQVASFSGLPGTLTLGVGSAGVGIIATFNGPDGGIFVGPVFVEDVPVSASSGHARGRMRGLWDWGHAFAAANDGDTFPGTGALASKTFREFKTVPYNDAGGNPSASGVLVGETSNTWETN